LSNVPAHHTHHVFARVPESLADALQERAAELGVKPSHLVREAVAEKLSKPARKTDRAFIAAWLAGHAGKE
jgi:predicted transcriptional regulator